MDQKYLMFKQLGNSLKEPFVNYFGFWCGIELFRRLFVAIIIAAFPQNLVWHNNYFNVLIN